MQTGTRSFPLFSLCGLNCALCPIHHMANGCPGCGGGVGHRPCAIVRCSRLHGNVEYCSLCAHYPCAHYDGAAEFDSFLPRRNMFMDARRAKEMGFDAYRVELMQKQTFLRTLLAHYNDGRRKTFFCTATNLLSLADIASVCQHLDAQDALSLPLQERAALAVDLLKSVATKKGIDLTLHRKPKQA